jgi:hypothetical protein
MTTAYLTNEKYGGRPVVSANGYKYYVVSKHRTQFNAHRASRRLDNPSRILKIGTWWMILQTLPKKFQNGRMF